MGELHRALGMSVGRLGGSVGQASPEVLGRLDGILDTVSRVASL